MEQQNDPYETLPTSQVKKKRNIGGMVKWSLIGLAIGFIVGAFIGSVADSLIIFLAILVITTILFGIRGAKSKTKEELSDRAASQVISEEGLTKNEKIVAWVFSITNPIITGAVMYYMWRKRYPTKAREANHISMIVFVVEISLLILTKVVGG